MTNSLEQIAKAIEDWNGLIDKVPDKTGLCESFKAWQYANGYCYGDEPNCNVLRPRFLTRAQIDQQDRIVPLLTSAAEKASTAIIENQSLQSELGESFVRELSDMLAIEPEIPDTSSHFMRFDAFHTGDDFHIMELNGESPGGLLEAAPLHEYFETMQVFDQFTNRHTIRNALDANHCLRMLGRSVGCSIEDQPTIGAIAMPDKETDRTDVEYYIASLRQRGVNIVAMEPPDFDYDSKRKLLHMDDVVIDIVYRVTRTSTLFERRDRTQPLLDAIRDDAIKLTNPLRGALISHKGMLGLLSDDTRPFGLSNDERAAVRAAIPWGRLLSDTKTTDPDGNEIDLADFVASNKDRLVLKPMLEMGGTGVVLGWLVNQSEWESAISDGWNSEHMIQLRLEDRIQELYPLVDNDLEPAPRYQDMNPYVIGGKVVGQMSRVSPSPVTNFTNGGRVTPIYILE